MNSKLIFKMVFVLLVLLLLVLMGMGNHEVVTFALPPIFPHGIKLPAAIMYFAFCAIGFVTGTVLTAGGSKRPSSGSYSRSSKSSS